MWETHNLASGEAHLVTSYLTQIFMLGVLLLHNTNTFSWDYSGIGTDSEWSVFVLFWERLRSRNEWNDIIPFILLPIAE